MAGGPLVPREKAPPPARLKIASSLETAKKDELILLDPRGGVLGRWGVRRVFARAYGVALFSGAAWGAGIVTAASLHPLAGLAGFSAYVWFIVRKLRWQVPLRRALAQVSARRYEQAHEELSALEKLPMPATRRPHVLQLLGGVVWMRGEHARALALFDEAIALTTGQRAPNQVTCRWICVLSRANLLVLMGRRDEVLRARGELEAAPSGELFAVLKQQIALALAFDAGDAALLPDTVLLLEWARAALLRNRLGVMLIYLAWAFGARGDDEMARVCLEAGEERLEHPIDRSNPRLHAWMVAAQQAGTDELA